MKSRVCMIDWGRSIFFCLVILIKKYVFFLILEDDGVMMNLVYLCFVGIIYKIMIWGKRDRVI